MEAQQGEVLVVSAGRQLTEALRPQLAAAGLSLRRVQECSFLLEESAENRPSLVVMDLQPPTARWLDLCRELRSECGIALIALLPWPDPDLATTILDIGADDCLANPVSPRELTLRIRAVLRRTCNY